MKHHDKYFTREEIIRRFQVFDGEKTLGEVDVRDVFHTQVPAKEIAGCVIEQSVLSMKQNSTQEADLSILQADGSYKDTELKVTGVEPSNKQGEKYAAKEPMSLTAVSIGVIEHEKFLESHFYNKIAHMLFVFYVYDRKSGQKVVPYAEYDRFPVLGYKFLDIADDKDELAKFENDWTQVHDYLVSIENREDRYDLYPLLHQKIKKDLFYIDIAPRFKLQPRQTPRFRFKKSYVNTLFQNFYNHKLEKLSEEFNSYSELDRRLHALTEQYRGRTVEELIHIFGIEVKDIHKLCKHITETIVVHMLGGKSKKISNIELFEKIGLIAKTITVTRKGMETEQMKLFTMDLDEITDASLDYEDTSYYEYFSNHQMLCILFEEPCTAAPLNDNVFQGFKRLVFEDEMINGPIRNVYNEITDKINNNGVVERYVYRKDGTQRINDTGVPMTALNFPKQAQSSVFVRGTGTDSNSKPWVFKGRAADGTDTIHAYSQQIWIKGRYITDMLRKIDFI